jgi:hypothetical protein
MSLKIRPPRLGDGTDMARLWVGTGAYYAGLDPEHFQIPSAEGLAEAFEESIATGSFMFWIGTALLEAAQAWGRSQGATVARLDTYVDGPVAVPFYERHMGYQRRSVVFQKWLEK